MKTAILMVNIGTPASYKVADVRKYLQKFLMDPFVLQIPYVFRFLLVYTVISLFRASKSAEKYKKIWMPEGSPLQVWSDRFENALQQKIPYFMIRTAMLTSTPSLESCLRQFQSNDITKIIFVPMFPQYAESTTAAAEFQMREALQKLSYQPKIVNFGDFFDAPELIQSWAHIIKKHLTVPVDQYLFSFHGLPESHLRKIPGCLASPNCCDRKEACAMKCYKAQCHKTAELIAKNLGLNKDQWSICFQSRLGRAKWIGPATDETLRDFPARGFKRVAVICPAFVVDGLETLEEIEIEGKNLFLENGGTEFHFIPGLNDDPVWVDNFKKLIARYI